MKFTDSGTETAEALRKVLAKSSAPKLARGRCGTQSLYDIRDGHLPGRLLIPVLARVLAMPATKVAKMVARDRSARGRLHGRSRSRVGAA